MKATMEGRFECAGLKDGKPVYRVTSPSRRRVSELFAIPDGEKPLVREGTWVKKGQRLTA